MKHLLPFVAVLPLCVLFVAVDPALAEAPTPSSMDGYRYRLAPLVECAPALDAALTALQSGDGLAEAQAGVSAWLSHAGGAKDPWEVALGRVLHARLDGAQGRTSEAITALEAHLTARGAHQDMARKSLATLYGAEDPARRLSALVALTSGPVDHAKRIVAASAELPPASVIPQLAQSLRRPWTAEGRRHLSAALAAARERSGDKAAAISELRALWWQAGRERDRSRWADRLASLGASPSFEDRVSRLVLKAKRSGLRKARRALKKLRPRSAHQRRVVVWARAVLDRLEPHKRSRAVRQLKKVRRRLSRTSFAPTFLYGEAAVLRKVGRDVEAAARYEALAADHPGHWLATDALIQAGGLRMWVDQPHAASRCYEAAAARDDHGRAHREGLWNASLAALLLGEHAAARDRLDRLVTEYGAVTDGVGLTWLERGLYWSGRAAAALGDDAGAEAHYRALSRRFPAGWYAMLARSQLEAAGLPPEPEGSQAVTWSPALDEAVLELRTDQVASAVHRLDALMRADRLAGQGRALLADALMGLGRLEQAASVRTRYGLPVARPKPSEIEVYGALYEMPFRPLVEGSATSVGIPVALLAGLIHVESRYQPKAKSGAGAIGLCQLLPATARVVGRRLMGRRITSRSLRDPETNIELGARFLGALWGHFQGHPVLALAAYNAGRGAARSWLRARGHLPTDLFVETIPYDQARRYVKRVIAVGESYRRLYELGDDADALRVPLTLPPVLAPYVLEEPPPPPPESPPAEDAEEPSTPPSTEPAPDEVPQRAQVPAGETASDTAGGEEPP